MREAIKIVIDRMQSHPEDFDLYGKFRWVFEESYGVHGDKMLTNTEVRALKQAHRELMYRRFHARVMKSLLDDGPQEKMYAEEMQKRPYQAAELGRLVASQGFNGTFTNPHSILKSIV